MVSVPPAALVFTPIAAPFPGVVLFVI